jgi:hypothetical protein
MEPAEKTKLLDNAGNRTRSLERTVPSELYVLETWETILPDLLSGQYTENV